MSPSVQLTALPPLFRQSVRTMCRKILRHYPNTTALVVIGSVALGTWSPDSDVDLVWILRGRRRKRWHEELGYDYSGRVELVTFNLTDIRQHLTWRSPMAHAIQRGVILYDPHGLVKRWQRIKLGPPTRQWMQHWFDFFWRRLDIGLYFFRRARSIHRRLCKKRCLCQVSEILTRAVVNLALILLTTKGLVPTSKAEMRQHLPTLIRSNRWRAAIETALKAHHEKRDLNLVEANDVAPLGRWLRARLVRILSKPPSACTSPHRPLP